MGVNQIEQDKADKEERRWEGLSTGEKVRDWGKRYQWSIVGGRSVSNPSDAGLEVLRRG